MNKNRILRLSLFANFILALFVVTSGYAEQLIELVSGQTIRLPGYVVTCELQNPTPPSSTRPTSTVYFNGGYLNFFRGPGGQLMVKYLNTGRLTDLGGVIKGEPIAFVDSNAEVRVIAVGTDDQIYSRTLTKSWEAYNGSLLEMPYVIVMNGETYIIGRGTDSAVYYRTLTRSWISLGGAIISELTVSPMGSDIFIQGIGTDNQLYDRTLTRSWQLSQ